MNVPKFPFVPRSIHDDVVADLRKRLDESETARAKLTKVVIRMKLTGASIVPRRPVDGGLRLEQRERDEFEKAVDSNPHCQNNPRLRRQQLKWARDEMEKPDADRDLILRRLSGWHLIEGDDDDDDEDEHELESVG